MKKRYIFMIAAISEVGGAELYVLNKVNWLEAHGWETHVICSSCQKGPYKIKELDKYRSENFPVLQYLPSQCPQIVVKRTIKQLKKKVNYGETYAGSIIESNTGAMSIWGELLARELEAKHVIELISETYEDLSYKLLKDYYNFKFERGELFGGVHAIHQLFDGFREFDESNVRYFELNENPVQDINDERLELISDADYNICYIGRLDKSYVPSVITGVGLFAQKYKNKSIEFEIVGDAGILGNKLSSELGNIDNLKIVKLGNMVPIPRKIFQIVDVVIAGSGSARCATSEGAITIVADPFNNLANGVLGYDTYDSVLRKPNVKQCTFSEALDNALVYKEYMKKSFRFQPDKSVDDCCNQNMRLIDGSCNLLLYYNREQLCFTDCKITQLLKSCFASYLPNIFRKITIKKRRNS